MQTLTCHLHTKELFLMTDYWIVTWFWSNFICDDILGIRRFLEDFYERMLGITLVQCGCIGYYFVHRKIHLSCYQQILSTIYNSSALYFNIS